MTDRQIMQIKRAIGYKYGLTRDSVDITTIRNVPANVVVDRGRILLEVDFSHQTGYWGTEIFSVNPSDGKTAPFLMTKGEAD